MGRAPGKQPADFLWVLDSRTVPNFMKTFCFRHPLHIQLLERFHLFGCLRTVVASLETQSTSRQGFDIELISIGVVAVPAVHLKQATPILRNPCWTWLGFIRLLRSR